MYTDYDKTIQRAIYARFGREISDEIGRVWGEPPSFQRHQPYHSIQVPQQGIVSLLYEKELASYLFRVAVRDDRANEYLYAEQLFTDRPLQESERATFVDYATRAVREEFLHHLAERDISRRLK